jgi:molecular chaperone DnaK
MKDELSLTLLTPPNTSIVAPNRPMRVLGIDLGTTNSTVAEIFWQPGEPVHARCLEIDQKTGEGVYTHVLVPSIVAIHGSNKVIGEGAKRLRSRSGELELRRNRNLFFDCKNDIGLRRTYHVAPDGYRSASQIAAHVLRFLSDAAISDEPTVPTRTVVTVPASFQAAQRHDTLEAARLAGLMLSPGDLLDEPVAAFIDFIVSQRSGVFEGISGARRLLVFDFGGGTCDVAVFEVRFGAPRTAPTISPLAVSRYHRLGGGDIDTAIVHEILVPQVIEQNGLSEFDLSFDDKKNFVEPALLSVAEALKVGLCSEIRRLEAFGKYANADKASIVKVQPGLHRFRTSRRELTLQSPRLTAAEFEKTLDPFLDDDKLYSVEGEYQVSCSIFAPITDAVERARLKADQIDFCLLVGGSSLIPQIAAAVRGHFRRAKVLTYDDPVDVQTAIARGAAYHSLTLSAFGRGMFQPAAHDDISINTSSGLVTLIKRGTLLPARADAGGSHIELAVPATTFRDPCRLRVEILAGSGDNKRPLFKGMWDIPGPVNKGDPLLLKSELDENQVLQLELRLAKADEVEPFKLSIENPLTHVSNPLREQLRIDELEKELRAGKVPEESRSDTFVELADGYRELGHREKALEYLRRALQFKGRPDAAILNKMAIICGELGDTDREEKLYREAAEASEWVGSLFNLALSQFRRDKYREAWGTIQDTLKRSRSAPYLVLAGKIAAALGQSIDRDKLFAEARERFSVPAAMDDFALDWARALGGLLPDEEFLSDCDAEWRRRKAGNPQRADEGLPPDVPGSIVKL